MKVCANIISPLILNAQQNGPFLPDLFEGLWAAAPSGYLACGATPGHKGGKHRSTTTSSLKRALSPFALSAMTDPGRTQRRRTSLSWAETSIRATIPPETQPKKAAQAFFNWFPRNKHFSLKWNNLLIACYNQMRGQCTFCVCTNSHVKSCARSEWRFLFLPNQEIR